MTHHPHVPSDDDAISAGQLISDCGCVLRECACHGVMLDVPAHPVPRHPCEVHISDDLRQLTDGISDYGD